MRLALSVDKLNMYYTYVLYCESTQICIFYIGYCKDLKKRVNEHSQRKIITTKKFDKIKLIYYEACLNKTDAIKRELQLKTGFGRGYLKNRLKNDKLLRV